MAPIDYSSGFALPKTTKSKRPAQGMKRTSMKRSASPLKRAAMKKKHVGGEPPAVRKLPDGREICNLDAWLDRRVAVWRRDGKRCMFCGKSLDLKAAEIDHIIKRGLGGGTRDDRMPNLRTLCRRCHRDRHRAEDAPGPSRK